VQILLNTEILQRVSNWPNNALIIKNLFSMQVMRVWKIQSLKVAEFI